MHLCKAVWVTSNPVLAIWGVGWGQLSLYFRQKCLPLLLWLLHEIHAVSQCTFSQLFAVGLARQWLAVFGECLARISLQNMLRHISDSEHARSDSRKEANKRNTTFVFSLVSAHHLYSNRNFLELRSWMHQIRLGPQTKHFLMPDRVLCVEQHMQFEGRVPLEHCYPQRSTPNLTQFLAETTGLYS